MVLTSTDGSDNCHIEGNFVGTNAAGTADLGNGSTGVSINGLNDGNVVGGSAPEQRNLISGNGGDGVFAGTDGDDTIQGNLIGTDKTGTKDLHNGTDNNGEGVNLGGQNSVVKDNIIAFNTSDGVMVRSNQTGIGHDIGPNSIFSNDGMGIDIVHNQNNSFGPNTNGTASINAFVATKSVPVGQSITATATDAAGNTSEFTGEPRSVRSAT